MFDVGGGELIVILLIILLLFGPKKIPEFMQMVGKGIRQFKKAQEDLTEQIRDLSTQDPTAPATVSSAPPPDVPEPPAQHDHPVVPRAEPLAVSRPTPTKPSSPETPSAPPDSV